jgi:hypothetical protein
MLLRLISNKSYSPNIDITVSTVLSSFRINVENMGINYNSARRHFFFLLIWTSCPTDYSPLLEVHLYPYVKFYKKRFILNGNKAMSGPATRQT